MMDLKEIIEKKTHLTLDGHVLESKYFFFDTDPKKKHKLAIIFGGFEKCAPDFEIKRKTYPYYVIEVPTKGRCEIKIGNKWHVLEKGVLGGFAPGIPHHYKCDKNSPMEHIFVVFTGSDASLLFEKNAIAKDNVVSILKPLDILYLAEALLKTGLEKNELSHQLVCVYLEALLLEQASNLILSGHSDTLAMDRYRKCRKYIDENFSSIFLPIEVAKTCSTNIRYLSRLFKRYSNTTSHEYIMRLKLNKAGNLLLTTNLSVREVGYLVGFEDPYHFSRNFKKFHGLSPQRYRDAHLESPLPSD
jgi:AraC-like DNA-binding protein